MSRAANKYFFLLSLPLSSLAQVALPVASSRQLITFASSLSPELRLGSQSSDRLSFIAKLLPATFYFLMSPISGAGLLVNGLLALTSERAGALGLEEMVEIRQRHNMRLQLEPGQEAVRVWTSDCRHLQLASQAPREHLTCRVGSSFLDSSND